MDIMYIYINNNNNHNSNNNNNNYYYIYILYMYIPMIIPSYPDVLSIDLPDRGLVARSSLWGFAASCASAGPLFRGTSPGNRFLELTIGYHIDMLINI
jgi:hypothetical protein